MNQDVTNLVVPLWPAILAGGAVVSAIMGTVAWVFTTFERKTEAAERHESLENRVNNQEKILNEVAQNVSYIRGRLEPK